MKRTPRRRPICGTCLCVKRSFLFPSQGARRQLDLFLPGEFSDPLPIHCWAIEHDGVLRLVDTGETAGARNVPFARMEVTREQELPAAMAAGGLAVDDVSEVVITHAHGDHVDGIGEISVNDASRRPLHRTATRARPSRRFANPNHDRRSCSPRRRVRRL